MTGTLATRLRPGAKAPRPGDHLGLTWRSATSKDLERISAIVTSSEMIDQVVRRTPAPDLSRLVHTPHACLDNLVGVDSAGVTQAFGAVRIDPDETEIARADLFAVTTPKWRGRGIGRALLTWQDVRARQLLIGKYGADSLLPARILNAVDSKSSDRRRLYTAAGFSPLCTLAVMRWDSGQAPTGRGGRSLTTLKEMDPALVDRFAPVAVKQLGKSQVSPQQARRWWHRALGRAINPLSFFAAAVPAGNMALEPNGVLITTNRAGEWLAAGEVDAAIEIMAAAKDDLETLPQLLDALVEAAPQNGVNSIAVEVNVSGSTAATAPLVARGFREVGKRTVYSIDL